ncbi:hypothetical protein [Aquimarina pacifica]|uniref:hypothetical protein n=1 Tax=Aquimarina pacifica TaxID=1296415 RepID=UPI0004B7AE3B|nr:hypothetical protein [Aquimarina pacifica]
MVKSKGYSFGGMITVGVMGIFIGAMLGTYGIAPMQARKKQELASAKHKLSGKTS